MARWRLPENRSLEAFSAAAHLGSFQAAATQLHITPSAVSQRISALETCLGTTLFERRSNAIALNSTGLDLLGEIDTALGIIANAIDRHRQLATADRIVLAAPPVDAVHWLFPRLGRFRDRYPGIDLQIRSSTCVVDLVSSGVDAALRSLPDSHRDESLVKHLLYREELIEVCAPHRPGSEEDDDPRQETRRLRSLASPEAWSIWDRAGHGAGQSRAVYIDLTDDTQTLEAASQGLGIALVHQQVARRWLQSGQLIQRSEAVLPTDRSCYLVYDRRHADRQSIEALLAWLIA